MKVFTQISILLFCLAMFSVLALADSLVAENTKTTARPEVMKDPDIITKIYQLQYASADKIKQYISGTGLDVKIVADPRINSVIVTGVEGDIQKVGKIVELLDVSVSDKPPIFAEYTQTVEDTDVMAAVIDKTMEKAFSGEYRELGGFFDTGCQGVFLKNYGVLFMMNVDFSVTKPPEEKPTQETKPDDLWEQTRREITEQGGFIGSGYGSTLNAKPPDSYDQAKVEKLKNELLKQIGDYANNIRNLGTNDSVTIVIRGRKNSESLDIWLFNAPKTGVNIGTTIPNVPKISTSIVTMPSEPFQPAAIIGSANITTAVPPPAVLPLPASSSGELSEAESYDNAYDNTSESVSSSFSEQEAGEIDQKLAKEEQMAIGGSDNASEAVSSLSEQRATGLAVQETQRANMKAYDLQQKANELRKRTYEIQNKMGGLALSNQMFARGAKTTMIISIKKQSVLDLKDGRINFDEFVKRAEITQY